MIALEFENAAINQQISHSLIGHGIFTDWFLFAPECLRIAPPLTISEEEILDACVIINEVLTGV